MKSSLALCATVLLVVLGLTACENATQGPSAWLDRPLDGEKVALEPLTIQAHASDADGVARFEFRVDNDLLATVPGSGVRFADAKAGWSPPAYGTYAVKARAIDGKGNVGSDAIAYVAVGERPTPTPAPSLTPSPTSSLTPSPTPSPAPLVIPSPTPSPAPLVISSPTPSPTPAPTSSPTPAGPPPGTSPAQIAFTADRYRLRQGECTLLHWTVQGGFGVELDGQPVPRLGQAQVCPPRTTTYRLGADEGESFHWETVTIVVEAAAPPPQPPTPTPTPAPVLRPPTPTPTSAPQSPQQPSDVRFWADSDNVAAGSCTTLRWHVAHVRAYWVDGEAGAGDDGSRQACPCGNETHTLHVVKGDGSEQDFHVTLRVQGECQAPPPPPPAQDNKGPKISDVGLRPLGSSDTGCRTVARAKVSDSSGVAWVRLHYSLNGDGWNTFDMGDRGGGSYEMPIPGSTGSGTIDFYVEASDSRGNTSQSGQSHQSLPPCGPG